MRGSTGARHPRRAWHAALPLALLALLLAAAPAGARAADPEILPPAGRHYGKTYGEWAAAWWQWILQQPAGEEATCGPSPTAGVWFGGGGPLSDEPVTLACALPAETALFFPILTGECSEAEGNGATEAELRACATALGDAITVAEVTIDGVAVRDVARYRVQSPLFTFTLPEDNPFGAPPGPSPSVADGYWLMLAPLAVGAHTIAFQAVAGAVTVAGPMGEYPEVAVAVTIDVTVGAAPTLPRTGGGGMAGSSVTPPLAGLGLAALLGTGLVLRWRRIRRASC